MLKLINLEPREYQKNILATCLQKSCLVVLPTGTGKTAIFLLAAIARLNSYPGSKVLICSPTKPLCNQHKNSILEHININEDEVALLTGAINPEARKELWHSAKIIIATPQTVQSDLERSNINLKDFSLLCIDEAHRSRMRYANTTTAAAYSSQATNPLILGLTASPGGTNEKIREICKNLSIEAVEIRSETDTDVQQYIQKRNIAMIEVTLSEELKLLHSKIKNIYLNKSKDLKKLGFNKPTNLVGKKDLLLLQQQLRANLNSGDHSTYYGLSLVASLLKLDYMLELLETQGLKQLIKFFENLNMDKSKAAKAILNSKEVQETIELANDLIKQGKEHPKFEKLKEIILQELKINNKIKIIVFANYRNTVSEILNLLDKNNIKCKMLIGQKSGLTQKQQIDTIHEFEESDDNVLVGTQILEEGIDVGGGIEVAVFYDAIPSDIRRIQRMGRVARIKTGKVIFLITKDTRDEAYFWSAYQKEKRMKKMLYGLKERGLKDFLES